MIFVKRFGIVKKEYTKQFAYLYDENVAIVLEERYGKPSLYVPVEDWYYSGTYLQINY